MADYALEMVNSHIDYPDEREPEGHGCRYCLAGPFYWLQSERGDWRLVDEYGKTHSCPEYFKVQNQMTPPKLAIAIDLDRLQRLMEEFIDEYAPDNPSVTEYQWRFSTFLYWLRRKRQEMSDETKQNYTP